MGTIATTNKGVSIATPRIPEENYRVFVYDRGPVWTHELQVGDRVDGLGTVIRVKEWCWGEDGKPNRVPVREAFWSRLLRRNGSTTRLRRREGEETP